MQILTTKANVFGLIGHSQSIGDFGYLILIHSLWKREPSESLTWEGQMLGYKHHSFWSCMDTLREKTYLEDLWQSGKAPWKMW